MCQFQGSRLHEGMQSRLGHIIDTICGEIPIHASGRRRDDDGRILVQFLLFHQLLDGKHRRIGIDVEETFHLFLFIKRQGLRHGDSDIIDETI